MFPERNAVVDTRVGAVASAGGAVLSYAGFWARVAALLVDWAILMIVGLLLYVVLGMAMGGSGLAIGNVIFGLLGSLYISFYWPVMESSARQATFGKQLLGIQVTDADGNRTSFIRAFLRNLAKIISWIPFGIGFLLAAFTSRKQALHDMITGCLVVRAGPSSFLKAVAAAVGGIAIAGYGSYYYVTKVYLPQTMESAMKGAGKEFQREMEKAMKGMGQEMAKEMERAMKQAEIDMKRQMEKAAREAQKAATSPPSASAPAAQPSVTAPAASKAQIAAVTPTPPPASAPAAKAAAMDAAKPAAAPVTKADAASKQAPEAAPSAVDKPKARRRVAKRKPAAPVETAVAPAAPAAAAPAAPVRTPKYNDIMTAVMFRDHAAAAELLELGWWVDRPESNGLTPLMTAAMYGDAAMVQLLLKHGADPNRSGPSGSVLAYAGRGGDGKVIDLLKKAGAQ